MPVHAKIRGSLSLYYGLMHGVNGHAYTIVYSLSWSALGSSTDINAQSSFNSIVSRACYSIVFTHLQSTENLCETMNDDNLGWWLKTEQFGYNNYTSLKSQIF